MLTFLIWLVGVVGIGYFGSDLKWWVLFILGFFWGMIVVEVHEKIVNKHNRKLE